MPVNWWRIAPALLAIAVLLSACNDGDSGVTYDSGATTDEAGDTPTGGGNDDNDVPTNLSDTPLKVVVLVVDSLMPDEIGTTTPNLLSLKDNGTFYAESRAVFSAETIPNHVAMMTGVYGGRNGIPTNNFWDVEAKPDTPTDEDLDNPNELEAKTLFTHIDEQCRSGTNPANPDLSTAAVLSKAYLYEIFKGDALDDQDNDAGLVNVPPDYEWNPRDSPAYLGDLLGYTPDIPTTNEALDHLDADFVFINLGAVDRVAHASGAVPRQAQLVTTDAQVGRIVAALREADVWQRTVLIVLSDHGMDYGSRGFVADNIAVQPMLDGFEACGFEPMFAVDNGGTDSLYLSDRDADAQRRQQTLPAVRACLAAPDGSACQKTLNDCGGMVSLPDNVDWILGAWYTQPNDADTDGNLPPSIAASGHPNLGDLVLAAEDGFNFSEPNILANPIPGNHGHPVTFHNTMLITGGVNFVHRGKVVEASIADPGPFDRLPEQSENTDVAPTVAWLLGLPIDAGDMADGRDFDGRVLEEAFTPFAPGYSGDSPAYCGLMIEGT